MRLVRNPPCAHGRANANAAKAINAIRSISKLANRNNYVYTTPRIEALSEALKREVVDMHKHFTAPAAATKEVCKF